MYQTRIVLAHRMMIDDRFQMGSQMYRILDIANFGDEEGRTIVWARNTETDDDIILMVGPQAKFKIYNQ